MKKQQIIQELINAHVDFVTFVSNLSKEKYNYSNLQKWNAGQHLDHIIRSVSILNKAFKLPKWLLKWKFGVANRPSRTKEILIAKYLSKLQTAKPTPKRFQPNKIIFQQREKGIKKLNKAIKELSKQVAKLSESDLDYYILPHPLLGKLTFRELIYFTAYHVEHHQELIENSLQNNQD